MRAALVASIAAFTFSLAIPAHAVIYLTEYSNEIPNFNDTDTQASDLLQNWDFASTWMPGEPTNWNSSTPEGWPGYVPSLAEGSTAQYGTLANNGTPIGGNFAYETVGPLNPVYWGQYLSADNTAGSSFNVDMVVQTTLPQTDIYVAFWDDTTNSYVQAYDINLQTVGFQALSLPVYLFGDASRIEIGASTAGISHQTGRTQYASVDISDVWIQKPATLPTDPIIPPSSPGGAPETSTWMMAFLGTLALGAVGWRKSKRSNASERNFATFA